MIHCYNTHHFEDRILLHSTRSLFWVVYTDAYEQVAYTLFLKYSCSFSLVHSMFVAQFEEYTIHLIDHLAQVKVSHWDRWVQNVAHC